MPFVVKNTPRGKDKHHELSSGNAGRASTTCFMACAIIFLLVAQAFMFQSCQNQIGSVVLETYGDALSHFASSVGLTSSSDSTLEGILTGNYDVCIAGAGLSGSVLAERYASQLGYKVLVVDKRDHIGGNCYDYTDVSRRKSSDEHVLLKDKPPNAHLRIHRKIQESEYPDTGRIYFTPNLRTCGIMSNDSVPGHHTNIK
jgi:hypothetical protein